MMRVFTPLMREEISLLFTYQVGLGLRVRFKNVRNTFPNYVIRQTLSIT